MPLLNLVPIQLDKSTGKMVAAAIPGVFTTPTGTGYVHVTGGVLDTNAWTPTQVTSELDLFTASTQGVVPSSGGGTTNFLRADGTWAPPPGAAGSVSSFNTRTGDVVLTSLDVTAALGFTPYSASNPAGFISSAVTSATAGAGISVSAATGGVTFTNTGVLSFNTRTGTVTLLGTDVTAALGYTPVNVTGDTMTGFLTLNADPVDPLHAATKQYVDSIAAGLTWKQAVKAATTGNITLSGLQTIDGILLNGGDRVLVKNQTTAAQNGIYVAAAGAWARASDADSGSELDSAAVFVQDGTTNSDTAWTQTSSNVTVGVTPILWSQFSGTGTYQAGTGLALVGNIFSNAGVLSNIAGTGISVSGATGNVTINNTGVVSFNTRTGAVVLTSQDVTDALGYVPGSSSGTVTSVGISGSSGIQVSGSPVTTAGVISLSLGNITPNSVAAVGTITAGGNITGANLSGTNTGDQTITLTGDVTGSGTGSFAATLATVNNDIGTFTNATITVDAKGRITAASSGAGGSGSVTSVDVSGGTTGFTFTGGPVTTSGVLTMSGTLAITNGGTGATSAAAARTNLGATTVGSNFFTLTDPSAITFPRINADNTVSALDAATFRAAIGAGTGTVTSVAATQPVAGLTISGSPITTSGTLTFALANDLAAVEGLATNGIAVRTGTDTWATRTITGTTNRITVTNGDGISGNPTLDISASYVGQNTITTVGTITTGTWNATTIATARGGTGLTSIGTANQILSVNVGGSGLEYRTLTAGSGISITPAAGSFTITATGGGGSVTSVDVSGGTTGLTFTGGPVTTSGTITAGGTLATTNGGTGLTSLGTANQVLGVNAGATGLEYKTITAGTGVTVTPSAGAVTVAAPGAGTERVVWRWQAGTPGANLQLISQTSGVSSVTGAGGAGITTYEFSGYSFPPTAIMIYGQDTVANTFSISNNATLGFPPVPVIDGGGTAATPNLISGFSSVNTVTLNIEPNAVPVSDGAGLGAYVIVVFKF